METTNYQTAPQTYIPPSIEVLEVEVEEGFAQSDPLSGPGDEDYW
jgi:hypothetical protein